MAKKKEKPKTLKEKIKAIRDNKEKSDDDKNTSIKDLILEIINKKKSVDDKKALLRELDKKDLEAFFGKYFKEFSIIEENYEGKLEPKYFWLVGFMRDDLGMKEIIKILDTFSATEASAFSQKMGPAAAAIQDRITQYLRQISILLKELFKYMREMKILDSRIDLFTESNKWINKRRKGAKFVIDLHTNDKNTAEIALKGFYIDVVEGGMQNQTSVLGLGQKVGFVELPELFFHTHMTSYKKEEIEAAVARYAKTTTQSVRNVLSRKLREYMHWRVNTEKNYGFRKKILLGNIKQLYYSLRSYEEWIKPLLRTIKRFEMNVDMKESADLLAAIEQSMVEVQLFGKAGTHGKFHAIVDVHIRFRTYPESRYDPRTQQQVMTHSGRIDITLKSRVMTDDQILAYKIWQEKDDFDLLVQYSEALAENIEDMKEQFWKYINEIEGKNKVQEEEKPAPASIKVHEPFVQVFKGFWDIGKVFIPERSTKKKETKKKTDDKNDQEEAKKTAATKTWLVYNLYKKAHKLVTW